MTKKTLTAAERLEKALIDLAANKQAAAAMAAEQAPELERPAELQRHLDALPQHERRKVLDAADLRHVSAAPRPIAPIRGGATSSRPTRRTAKAPNWSEWKHIPEVPLWQACALSLSIDPHSMKQVPHWGAAPSSPLFNSISFPSDDIEKEFHLRLRVLSANLPNRQFFSLGSVSMGHPSLHVVKLAEFAIWAVSVVAWEGLPPELVTLAQMPAAALSGAREKGGPPVSSQVQAAPEKSASSNWTDAARTIADEFFKRDTAMGCRDSLAGYSSRVMEEMQKRSIHGPRGRIDNASTIQRDALQGAKWWRNKVK